MRRVDMMLDESEVEALRRLAKKERRRPKDQAAKLVADALGVKGRPEADDEDTEENIR